MNLYVLSKAASPELIQQRTFCCEAKRDKDKAEREICALSFSDNCDGTSKKYLTKFSNPSSPSNPLVWNLVFNYQY